MPAFTTSHWLCYNFNRSLWSFVINWSWRSNTITLFWSFYRFIERLKKNILTHIHTRGCYTCFTSVWNLLWNESLQANTIIRSLIHHHHHHPSHHHLNTVKWLKYCVGYFNSYCLLFYSSCKVCRDSSSDVALEINWSIELLSFI